MNNNIIIIKLIISNKTKLISKTYFNSINPDRNIPKFTQNTKLTGILNFISPKPTITLPVDIIKPKTIDKIAPISMIVLYGLSRVMLLIIVIMVIL